MDVVEQTGWPSVERRREMRASLNFKITVRERGRNQQEALLANLSCFGCCVAQAVPARGQDTIWVRIPGIESQPATIRWAEGGGAGLAFDQALHPAVVARLSRGSQPDLHPVPAGTIPSPQPAEAPSSRKEQILSGWAEPSERILAKKQPQQNGKILQGLIRRRTSRVADHRLELRYPPPDAAAEGLRIDGRRAKVLNLSTSGLLLELAAPVEIGSTLPLSFEGFPSFEGQVVWKRDGQIGLSLPPNSIELCETSPAEPA